MTPADVPWAEWRRNLRAFIARRVPNDADVDDLVQRVLLQIVDSIGSLRHTDRIGAWIYRTARNTIVDHYRSAVVRREVARGGHDDAPFADRPAPFEGDDDTTALRELAACMAPLVGQLAPAAREALQFVDVEGMTQVEAASMLGVSVSGMKSRVQRARKQLRSIVEQCCHVDLDRRGGIIAYAPREAAGCRCAGCAPATAGAAAPAIRPPRARRAAS